MLLERVVTERSGKRQVGNSGKLGKGKPRDRKGKFLNWGENLWERVGTERCGECQAGSEQRKTEKGGNRPQGKVYEIGEKVIG